MFPKRLAGIAALALLINCSDSTGTVTIPGVVTFTYSGPLNGTYSATGNLPNSNSAQETTQWSAAGVDVAGVDAYVLSSSPRNSTSHDHMSLDIQRTTVGTVTIGSGCASTCGDMNVTFGQVNASDFESLQSCFLDAGSITVTEISTTRIKGTFSGTGTCFGPTGTATNFTVTAGAFDVQVLPSF